MPRIRLVEVKSPAEGMEWIAKGQVDATVSSLLVARFLIARQYRERLRIIGTVGDQPARIALATAPQAPAAAFDPEQGPAEHRPATDGRTGRTLEP